MTTSAPAFRGSTEPAFRGLSEPAGRDGPARTAMRPVQAPLLRVLPGTPESAGAARSMTRQLLGDGHPAAETVQLVVSELVTNAILHSKSGAPGGTVTLALCPGPGGGILVQVRDDGGPSEPRLVGVARSEEHTS